MTTRIHIGHLTATMNVVTPYMDKDSNALQRSTNESMQQIWSLLQSMLPKKKLRCITRTVAEILKHTNYIQVPCMHRTVPITVILKSPALMNHFAYSYKHKAIRLKVSRFQNLFIL